MKNIKRRKIQLKTNNLYYSRDPLGMKAPYYIQTEEGYRFASDIGKLLSLSSVTPKSNFCLMCSMMISIISSFGI